VVSIKTTGLTTGYDRICEISVVTIVPGQPLTLTLDTLVHPGRRLNGAEIHGIRDRDVAMAPTFEQVGLDLLKDLQERVIVGHNINFLMRFLKAEFKECGVELKGPMLDTMSLASLLTRTPNRPLLECCDTWDIESTLMPTSASGALDTAKLMRAMLEKLETMGLKTFTRLKGKGTKPYQQSLETLPMPKGFSLGLEESLVRLSRHKRGTDGNVNVALALYWDALLVALDDLIITDPEQEHLARLKDELEIALDQIYMLHNRVFASAIMAVMQQGSCDEQDRQSLASLRSCLTRLGWAPGD
jgi:DNA polymerase III epsilon subunit-like protein